VSTIGIAKIESVTVGDKVGNTVGDADVGLLDVGAVDVGVEVGTSVGAKVVGSGVGLADGACVTGAFVSRIRVASKVDVLATRFCHVLGDIMTSN
jgi:hypothetical protein